MPRRNSNSEQGAESDARRSARERIKEQHDQQLAENAAERERKEQSKRQGVSDEEVYRQQMEQDRMQQERDRRNEAAWSDTSSDRRNQIRNERIEAERRKAVTSEAAQLTDAERIAGAQIDESRIRDGGEQFRAGQLGLISQLEAQARGEGPSLAQSQLRQGTERNLSQLLAAQASSRGGASGAAANRNLLGAQAAANQQASAQSADLRMNEQIAARQQLAGALQNARSQDIGLRAQDIGLQQAQAGLSMQQQLANQQAGNQFALQQAGFQQQTNLANQQSAIQNQAQIDSIRTQLLQMGMGQEEADRQARLQVEQMNAQMYIAQQQAEVERYKTEMAKKMSEKDIWGTIMQGAGTAASVFAAGIGSDEKFKTNKKDGSIAISDFLNALSKEMNSDGSSGTGAGNLVELGPKSPESKPQIQGQSMMMTDEEKQKVAIAASAQPVQMNFPKQSEQSKSVVQRGAEFFQGAGAGAVIKTAERGAQGWHKSPGTRPTMTAASDKNNKESISEDMKSARSFLDALNAYTYEYKDQEKFGKGVHAGIMAQELEKAGPIGKSMVIDTPEGKFVNFGKGFGTILAGLVDVNDRLKALEERRSTSKGMKKGSKG